MLSHYIGNEPLRIYFDHVIHTKRPNHAYCFVGPSSIGKRTLAMMVAGELLGVASERVAVHPDVMMLDATVASDTQKVGIDEVRFCRSFVNATSFTGSFRIIILDGVDMLSIPAANALLKSLEEPPARAIFFLLAKNIRRIPMTVRSRCQVSICPPTTDTAIVAALVAQGVEEKKANEIAAAAHGLPGRAFHFVKDPEAFAEYCTRRVEFLSLQKRPLYETIQWIDGVVREAKDDDEEHVSGISIAVRLREWYHILHEQIRDAGMGAQDRRVAVDLYRRLAKSEGLLRGNVNTRLVLEQCFLGL